MGGCISIQQVYTYICRYGNKDYTSRPLPDKVTRTNRTPAGSKVVAKGLVLYAVQLTGTIGRYLISSAANARRRKLNAGVELADLGLDALKSVLSSIGSFQV